MIYYMYLWCGAVFLAVLVVKLGVVRSSPRRKREPTKLVPFTLDVPAKPIAISDLKKEETHRQLEDVFEEMLLVSKLIKISKAVNARAPDGEASLPPDSLPRFIVRQAVLRARFARLLEGQVDMNDDKKIVLLVPSMTRVKALPPARTVLRTRARRS